MPKKLEPRTRVIIADDRPRSRSALRALLSTRPSIEVIAEAADGREAIQLVEKRSPDVVIMDVRMPLMDGLTAARLIKDSWPEVKIIILTMYSPMQQEALDSGADTFLVKGCSAQELITAITEKTMLQASSTV